MTVSAAVGEARPIRRSGGFGPPIAPLTWAPGRPQRLRFPRGVSAWLVSDYDLAREVLGDDAGFSSAEAPFAHVMDDWDIGSEPPEGAIVRYDGDAHRRLRTRLLPEFTLRAMRAHVPALTGIAESLVDRLPETEAVDLVTAFARPMACASVCAVLGIPDHHASVIQECADAANSASLTKADRYEADARLRHLISAELTRMRHEVEPRGVLARLIQATGRSDVDLGHPEWLTLATMLATAGLKENTSQIALSVAMLLRQGSWPATSPDLADCLDLAESCIDWLTIIQWGIIRVVTSDRMVGDVAMRAGDLVVVSLLLANHDRARHGDRPAPAPPGGCPVAAHDKPQRHLSFGFGPHQCLGANLARVELAVSLMVLFQRCPNLTLQNVDHGSAMSPVWAPDRVMVGWKRT